MFWVAIILGQQKYINNLTEKKKLLSSKEHPLKQEPTPDCKKTGSLCDQKCINDAYLKGLNKVGCSAKLCGSPCD